MKETLHLTLHGLDYDLSTGHAPFLQYARQYLSDFSSQAAGEADVTVRLHWDASPPAQWSMGGVRQHGRRVLQIGEPGRRQVFLSEILELPGLQLAAGWAGERLEIEAYYRPAYRMGFFSRRRKAEQARLYAILVYYLFYFPVVYALYRARGWHLMHAGGIAFQEGGWVFAGLPGSGKTTFTLALLADPQVKLVSDNLLLFDGEQVHACPEPLHLSDASWSVLSPDIQRRLLDTRRFYSHGRRDFQLLPAARSTHARPTALFFLGLSDQDEVKPLSQAEAFERLGAYDRLAKETQAFEQFAAALDLAAPGITRSQARHAALSALLSDLPAYELWVKKGTGLVPAIQRVKDLMHGKAHHDNQQSLHRITAS